MADVVVREDESFDRAFRRFQKKVEKGGVLADLKKRRYYEKPSDRRKRKHEEALQRQRRQAAKAPR